MKRKGLTLCLVLIILLLAGLPSMAGDYNVYLWKLEIPDEGKGPVTIAIYNKAELALANCFGGEEETFKGTISIANWEMSSGARIIPDKENSLTSVYLLLFLDSETEFMVSIELNSETGKTIQELAESENIKLIGTSSFDMEF